MPSIGVVSPTEGVVRVCTLCWRDIVAFAQAEVHWPDELSVASLKYRAILITKEVRNVDMAFYIAAFELALKNWQTSFLWQPFSRSANSGETFLHALVLRECCKGPSWASLTDLYLLPSWTPYNSLRLPSGFIIEHRSNMSALYSEKGIKSSQNQFFGCRFRRDYTLFENLFSFYLCDYSVVISIVGRHCRSHKTRISSYGLLQHHSGSNMDSGSRSKV